MDIVALTVGSVLKPVLAVLCRNLDDALLFTVDSALVLSELPECYSVDDSNQNQEISEALQRQDGEWASECFWVLTVTEGWASGVRAVGVGSNVRKCERAARLALVAALAVAGRRGTPQRLQHVVAQAERALAAGATVSPLAVAFDKAPMGMPPATRLAEPKTATPAPRSREPDDHLSPAEIDPAAPRVCIEDPASELRVWSQGSHGKPTVLWPYCTSCKCWNDVQHYWGQRHQKALRMIAWFNSSEDCDITAPSESVAGGWSNVDAEDTAGEIYDAPTVNSGPAAHSHHASSSNVVADRSDYTTESAPYVTGNTVAPMQAASTVCMSMSAMASPWPGQLQQQPSGHHFLQHVAPASYQILNGGMMLQAPVVYGNGWSIPFSPGPAVLVTPVLLAAPRIAASPSAPAHFSSQEQCGLFSRRFPSGVASSGFSPPAAPPGLDRRAEEAQRLAAEGLLEV